MNLVDWASVRAFNHIPPPPPRRFSYFENNDQSFSYTVCLTSIYYFLSWLSFGFKALKVYFHWFCNQLFSSNYLFYFWVNFLIFLIKPVGCLLFTKEYVATQHPEPISSTCVILLPFKNTNSDTEATSNETVESSKTEGPCSDRCGCYDGTS